MKPRLFLPECTPAPGNDCIIQSSTSGITATQDYIYKLCPQGYNTHLHYKSVYLYFFGENCSILLHRIANTTSIVKQLLYKRTQDI